MFGYETMLRAAVEVKDDVNVLLQSHKWYLMGKNSLQRRAASV